jgi:hypothetical protein
MDNLGMCIYLQYQLHLYSLLNEEKDIILDNINEELDDYWLELSRDERILFSDIVMSLDLLRYEILNG